MVACSPIGSASELADKITAIAAVSGYLPGYSGMPFPVPYKPVPVIHFHGTADATIPYSEAEEATGYWIDFDECISQPNVVDLPNADPSDGTTVNEMMYENGDANSEVQLYKINNGGHTWPGTASHAMPGKVCKDIDATSIIWNFFKSHSGAAANPATGGFYHQSPSEYYTLCTCITCHKSNSL
jgi:polyhydroxybutyrate depolymerase